MENNHIIIEKRTNSAAKISIALSIIGFVLSLIPFFGWLLMPVWILAILFGVLGLFNPYKRGLAVGGIVIGGLTFVYKIIFLQALFG
jgi:hypothetical protein